MRESAFYVRKAQKLGARVALDLVRIASCPEAQSHGAFISLKSYGRRAYRFAERAVECREKEQA